MQSADEIFCLELTNRGLVFAETDDGRYEVQIGEQAVMVSLDNIRRNYQRDNDAEGIIRFVDQLDGDFYTDNPTWDAVQPYVRYALEPSDYESGFSDILFNSINDELNQVFVYTPADGSRIIWINESRLEEWGVTRAQVITQAEENMNKIIFDAEMEVKDIDGHKLGMISTEEVPFKASLILSSAFRELVSPSHGWPVYVVVPCRDFAYVIRQDDHEFLGRLGRVVIDEYRESGHPITKDVLQVSDEGITAIGTFPDS